MELRVFRTKYNNYVFLTCGFTTVLSSYHFINTIIYFNENKRIVFYICLVTASGLLSVSNFDMILMQWIY